MAYSVELDDATQSIITMQLFENVKNTSELRKKAMSGKLECCLIKSNLIFDPFQVVVAANKALTHKKRTTKSNYTEILFNLSLSSNITQSLQTFGVADSDTNILVVVISKKNDTDSAKEIFSEIDGDILDISELSCINDRLAIKKLYKISDVEYHNIDLLDSIVSRIATKD
ncbi:EKC/KEOPS complex subunit TPRKB-like [Sitophilus oryzae]|uniref:EKC/KEOPS complex subunit TPRKB-like n=1 Tax=Sitophilus oryzae TaxID=7048 RepID=A0A6J2YAD8_SITOR|nr:EKC/KEOPS complex subunit TPRKB-like [Sitophilus oryzae]